MFKKLSFGCLGLVALGILLIIVAGVVGSRQSPQTITSPSPTVAAAQAATTPTPVAAKPEPTAVSTAPVAKIGDRVESGGIALTVNGVTRTDSLSQFQKAKPGRVYVVADVTIESITREKAPYNPLYFKVKDADGYEYTASVGSGDQALKSGELNPGEKARGTVAFDVPATATGLVLSYQPLVILGGYQTIRVALD